MVLYSAIKDLTLIELLETIENVWCCLDCDSKKVYFKKLIEIKNRTTETVSESQILMLQESVSSTE
jgi:hypothetical protein